MYIYVIFDPNQAEKPQGNKVVQYFEILNSVSLVYISLRPKPDLGMKQILKPIETTKISYCYQINIIIS